MRHKTISGARVEIKSEERGEVVAMFARLNTIDHDNDVTVKGAFQSGQQVRISSFNHQSWHGALPVGRGVIFERGDEAIMGGRFFLGTTAGAETFETVKELAELGEWSYGFHVLDSEPGEFEGKPVTFLKRLDVVEVSPVLQGAGIGTHTVAVKRARPDDRAELHRHALVSMARASIALAGLRDPLPVVDPHLEKLARARALSDRVMRGEVRRRILDR